MGHALLIVIVEPDTLPMALAQRVQDLMEPYDQDSEASGRETVAEPCACTEQGDQAVRLNCQDCAGTGTATFTYNPVETFDWYTPGGRWDGTLQGEGAVQRQWPDLVPEEIGRNMVVVREVPERVVPGAVLTPDGEWHGGGSDAQKDMDAWTIEQAGILSRYPNHLAIGIDFHY